MVPKRGTDAAGLEQPVEGQPVVRDEVQGETRAELTQPTASAAQADSYPPALAFNETSLRSHDRDQVRRVCFSALVAGTPCHCLSNVAGRVWRSSWSLPAASRVISGETGKSQR